MIMGKGYFSRFVEWQNYVHYALLSGVVSWFAWWLGAPFDWKMVAETFGVLFVGDSLVHALFWFAPKPFRWRD